MHPYITYIFLLYQYILININRWFNQNKDHINCYLPIHTACNKNKQYQNVIINFRMYYFIKSNNSDGSKWSKTTVHFPLGGIDTHSPWSWLSLHIRVTGWSRILHGGVLLSALKLGLNINTYRLQYGFQSIKKQIFHISKKKKKKDSLIHAFIGLLFVLPRAHISTLQRVETDWSSRPPVLMNVNYLACS